MPNQWPQHASKPLHLIRFFISRDHAHCLNERVAWIVNPSLDALINGIAARGPLVPQFGINCWSEALSHAVVVFTKIRIVCTGEREIKNIHTELKFDLGF